MYGEDTDMGKAGPARNTARRFSSLAWEGILLVLIGCGGTNTSDHFSVAGVLTAGDPNSVHLSWEAPARSIDGSPLVDLAGYRLHHGRGSRVYTEVLEVGRFTACAVGGLPSGTWYFAVTAYDFQGNESPFSNEARADVP